MKIPILYEPENRNAVIVGYSKESTQYATFLASKNFCLFIAYENDEELSKWKEDRGKSDWKLISARFIKDWLSKKRRPISVFMAGKERAEDNEELLLEAIKAGVPLRASKTPSFLSNFSIPAIQRSGDFEAFTYDNNAAVPVSSLLLKNACPPANDIDFQIKYDTLSQIAELVGKDEEEFERLKDSLSSIVDLGIDDLIGIYKNLRDKVDRPLVVGLIKNTFGSLEAKEFCEDIMQQKPELSIELREYELDERKNIKFAYSECEKSFRSFLDIVRESYETLAKALLNREIDVAFVNPIHLYYNNGMMGSPYHFGPYLMDGLECLQRSCQLIKNDFVILNKNGIASIDQFPSNSTFLYDEFDLLPQIEEIYYDSVFEYESTWTSMPLTVSVEEYLSEEGENQSPKFLTFSKRNLELLGYTDEKLREMGLTIIEESFAHPVGYGDLFLLYRKDDCSAYIFAKSPWKNQTAANPYYIKGFLERFCWVEWNSHTYADSNDIFLVNVGVEEKTVSVNYEDIKLNKITIFGKKANKPTSYLRSKDLKTDGFRETSHAVLDAVDQFWNEC